MNKCLAICLLIFGLGGILQAFPFANYGNIRVPDAYVMPHLMGKIAINNYLYPEHDSKDDDIAYNWAVAVNMGLFNLGEIGLVASGDEIYYAHIKAKIISETLTLPDLSIGVDNLFSKVPSKKPYNFPGIVDAGSYRRDSIYLAISKTILLSGIPQLGDLPTRVTIGAGTHRFQGTMTLAQQVQGVFVALLFEPVRNFTVITEVDGHNFNAGFEHRYRKFAGRIELFKLEEWSRRDPKFGFTISYLFDRFVSSEKRQEVSPTRTYDRRLIETREETTLDELQRIRRQRERAEQELEEIRRLLEQ